MARTAWTESGAGPAAPGIAVLVCLAMLWGATHSWGGIRHDGVLYAAQAVSHLDPALMRGDLFFAWGSQDDFTIFGRVYAAAASLLGLPLAARLLWSIAQILWFAAALAWIRRCVQPRQLMPAAAVVFALPGYYGSDVVFRVAEPFLTARPYAEAMVLLGLLALSSGARMRVPGVALLAAASLVHPIMAAPGVLCALALAARDRCARGGTRSPRTKMALAATLAITAIVAIGVVQLRPGLGIFERIDQDWYAMVLERSALVVAAEWSAIDWARIALPLAIVALYGGHVDARWRGVWRMLALIGGIGLVLALVSSLARWKFGLQVQFWRLAWPAVWFAPLAAVVAAGAVPGDARARRVLALSALPALAIVSQGWWNGGALVCAAWFAMAVASERARIPETPAAFRIAVGVAVILCLAAIADGLATLYVRIAFMGPAADPDASVLALAVEKFGWLVLPAFALLATRAFMAGGGAPARWSCIAACVVFAAFAHDGRSDTRSGFERLIAQGIPEWIDAIPANATVFWPHHLDRVWLVLGRRSYVSRGQLAGGIFQREVVIEGTRRAAVVERLELADDAIQPRTPSLRGTVAPLARPDLERACVDPILDFVVLQAKLGPTAATPFTDAQTRRVFHLHGCNDYR